MEIDKKTILEHIIVLEIYTLLTIIAFHKLFILGIDNVLIGDGGDAYSYVWNFWWVKKAIFEGKNVFYTNYLFYPQGVDLHFHSLCLFWSLISIPFTTFLGYVKTYNLFVMGNFVLSAYSMFLASKYLIKRFRESAILGYMFGFSPYNFGKAIGHLDMQTTFIFPIVFLLTYLYSKNKKTSNLILLGLAVGFTIYIAQYYYIFSILFVGFFLLFMSISKKLVIVEFIKSMVIISVISLVVAFPYTMFYAKDVLLKHVAYQKVTLEDISNNDSEGISIIDYFIPTPFSILGIVFRTENLRTTVSWCLQPSITYSLIFLYIALLGMSLKHKTYSESVFKIYLPMMIIFFLLSLGPIIKTTRSRVLGTNYLYILFYRLFPEFDSILSPGRFSLVVFLLMIFSVVELLKTNKRTNKKISLAMLLVTIFYFTETFPVFYLYSSSLVETGNIVRALLVERNDIKSVLNIPPSIYAMYLQIFHEKPIEDIGQSYIGRVRIEDVIATKEKIELYESGKISCTKSISDHFSFLINDGRAVLCWKLKVSVL